MFFIVLARVVASVKRDNETTGLHAVLMNAVMITITVKLVIIVMVNAHTKTQINNLSYERNI